MPCPVGSRADKPHEMLKLLEATVDRMQDEPNSDKQYPYQVEANRQDP